MTKHCRACTSTHPVLSVGLLDATEEYLAPVVPTALVCTAYLPAKNNYTLRYKITKVVGIIWMDPRLLLGTHNIKPSHSSRPSFIHSQQHPSCLWFWSDEMGWWLLLTPPKRIKKNLPRAPLVVSSFFLLRDGSHISLAPKKVLFFRSNEPRQKRKVRREEDGRKTHKKRESRFEHYYIIKVILPPKRSEVIAIPLIPPTPTLDDLFLQKHKVWEKSSGYCISKVSQMELNGVTQYTRSDREILFPSSSSFSHLSSTYIRTRSLQYASKGPFRLHDSTILYRTHDNLITFLKWVRTPQNKIPAQHIPHLTPSLELSSWFCLEGSKTFIKSDQTVVCPKLHGFVT